MTDPAKGPDEAAALLNELAACDEPITDRVRGAMAASEADMVAAVRRRATDADLAL